MAAIDPNAPKRKTLQDTIADGLGAPPDGTPGSVSPYGYMNNSISADGAQREQTPAVQPTQYETGGVTGGPQGGTTQSPPFVDVPTPTTARPQTTNRPVILGFDSAKLEDPNSGSAAGSKYSSAAKTFYKGLQADVGLSRGGLDNMVNFAKQNGFGNAKAVGDDKIDFGDGNGPVDVIRSDGSIVFQNTTGNPVWEAQGYQSGDRPATPGGGALGNVPVDAGGGMAAGGGGNPFASYMAQQNAERDSARAAILKLLEDSQKPVDPNDPNIQAQMQARDRQGQRAQERTRAMLAERAAANGDLSGGHGDGSFESSLNGLEQARGQDSADYAAGLIGQEQQARRQSLVQAIQLAEQSGQFDQSQALQMQLAQMDANLRQQALQLQRYGIDTNSSLQRYGIDTNAGLEGRRLDQQQGQFDTTMDFNSAQSDADNYYRWMMAGLNG